MKSLRRSDFELLLEAPLEESQILYFGDLKYQVLSCFLSNEGKGDNRRILTNYGLDAYKTCDLLYGWRNGGGDWPITDKDNPDLDLSALTRITLFLWSKEVKEKPKSLDHLINPPTDPLVRKFLAFTKKVRQNNIVELWEAVSLLYGYDLTSLREK